MFLTPPKGRRAQIKELFKEAKDLGLLDELIGKPGTDGKDGGPGEQGPRGDSGDRGEQGERGEKGERGFRGSRGPKGEKGDKGDDGARGPRGPRGERGTDGVDGKDAPVEATFITFEDERDDLPNSLPIEQGQGVVIERTLEGKLRISAYGSGGGFVGGLLPSGSFSGVNYAVQEEQERYWQDDELVRGHNIIGVRYAGAAVVYLPHDLAIEKIVSVKNEYGGSVSVRSY